MTITSKYCNLYLIKNALFFLVFIFVISLCFYYSIDSDFNINFICLLLGLFFLAFFISGIIDILSIGQFFVNEEGVEIIYLINRKKQFIPFDEIVDFQSERKRIRTSKGYSKNLYPISVLITRNKKQYFFSGEEFENYDEVLSAIRSNMKTLN